MAYFPIKGSRFYFSTGLASAVAISGITNADPPVVTSATHSYSDNDPVLLTDTWEEFTDTVFQVNQLSSTTFSLDGFDSTDEDFFPPGSDTGNAEKVTGWQEIGQVLNCTTEGGQPVFIELNPYDKARGIRMVTGTGAASINMTIGFDQSRTDQQLLLENARVFGKKAMKFVLNGGAVAYAYGTLWASEMPNFAEVLERPVVMTVDGRFTAYVA
jgi:hypothetical protein